MRRAMTIFRKELRDTIRDRRTLIVMVLMPIILMPLILVGTVKLQQWSEESTAEHVVRLDVAGAGNAPGLVEHLADDRMIDVVESSDVAGDLKTGTIDASLEIPDGFQGMIESDEKVELPLRINSTRKNSSSSLYKVELSVEKYSNDVVAERLSQVGQSTDILQGVDVTSVDTATEKEKGGTFLGFLLPMFLVLFAILGGMYTAMDISAGEKERKTLEALLLTPATRTEIVAGKFMTVALVSIVTMLLSVTSIFVTARFMSGSLGSVEVTLDAKVAAVMLPAVLLLAAMFAALLLAVSIFARSYKEAQNYVTPIYIVALLPVIVANAITGTVNPVLFVIPGFNAVILFRELLVGDYIASHIIITLVSMAVFTVLSIWWAVRTYSRDDVLVDEGTGRRKKGSIFGSKTGRAG